MFTFNTTIANTQGTGIWFKPGGRFVSVMWMMDMRLSVSAKLHYPSGLQNEGEPEVEDAGRSALMDSPQDTYMENDAKITTD